MKEYRRKERQYMRMNAVVAPALLLSIILPAAAATAYADAGLSVTAGSDGFLYNDVNADVDISSAVNAGAYYAHYKNDFLSPTVIYAANATVQAKSLSLSLMGYSSPETDSYHFYGAQATLGWQGSRRNIDIGANAVFGRTLNILDNTPGSGELWLHSNLTGLTGYLTYKQLVSLSYTYSFYYYQENPAAFFNAQFGSPVALPGIVFAVSGYPSRESHAGMSVYPGERWKLTLDWDRFIIETFDVTQSSLTWGATYYLSRFWGVSASYNLVNGTFYYYTLGIQWYLHGPQRGEQQQGISYNNIP